MTALLRHPVPAYPLDNSLMSNETSIEGPVSQWYAIRTATRQEFKACEELRLIGVTAYCPAETHERKHARVTDLKLKPLLPGYIFAAMTPAHVSVVSRVFGVSAIIGGPTDTNPKGQPVPLKDLVWLGAAEHLGAFNFAKPPLEPTYAPGRLVRVKSGKLSGALGQIIEAKGQKRFFVLIDWFGRKTRFDLERQHLEAAA